MTTFTIEQLPNISPEDQLEQIKTDLAELEDLVKLQSESEQLSQDSPEQLEAKKEEVQELIRKIEEEIQILESEIQDVNGGQNYGQELGPLKSRFESYKQLAIRNFQIELAGLRQEVRPSQTVNKPGWMPRLQEQASSVLDTQEWRNNPGRNIARSLGGVALAGGAIWGVRKIRGRFTGGNKKEGEKKSGSRWKRGLMRAGGIFGGIALWKNRGRISDFFKGLFGYEREEGSGASETPGGSVERQRRSFESMTQTEKQRYNGFAESINSYNLSIAGNLPEEEQLGGSMYDKENPGLVPYILNNRYDNVGSMLSEYSLYYEMVGMEINSFIAGLRKLPADYLGSILMPIAQKLNNVPLMNYLINPQRNIDAILNIIRGEPNIQENIRSVFRKSINIISYLNSRKRTLEYKLVEDKLSKDHIGRADLSEDDKLELVKDKMGDKERMKSNIDPQMETLFNNQKIYTLIPILEQYDVLETIDPITQGIIDDIENRKNDIIGYEEENGTIIDRFREKLDNGTLEESDRKELLDMIDGVLDDMSNAGERVYRSKYLPILDLFAGNEDIKQAIFESGSYSDLMEPIKTSLESVRDQISQKPLASINEEDLSVIESKADEYFDIIKHISIIEAEVSYIRQDNGSLLVRVIVNVPNSIYRGGKNLVSGVGMIIDRSSIVEGGMLAVGGAITIYPITKTTSVFLSGISKVGGITGLGSKLANVPFKLVNLPGDLVIKLPYKGAKILAGRSISYMMPKTYYAGANGFELLRYDVARGVVDSKKLKKLFTIGTVRNSLEYQIGHIKINTYQGFLQHAFPGVQESDLRFLIDNYGGNKRIVKEVLNIQQRSRLNPFRYISGNQVQYTRNNNLFLRLKDAHNNIGKLSNSQHKQLLTSIIKSSKNVDKGLNVVSDLLTKPKLSNLLSNIPTDVKISQLGKYIGSNINRIDDLQDFFTFLQKAKDGGKIKGNFVSFVKNAANNRSTISKKTGMVSRMESIDKLNLDKGGLLERGISSVKAQFAKISKTLSGMMLKTKHTPGVSQAAQQAKSIGNASPQELRGFKFLVSSKLTQVPWMTALSSQQSGILNSINQSLSTNPAIAKAISSARTIEDIKPILFNDIGLSLGDIKKLPPEFLQKLAKSKNITYIKDYVNYAQNYQKAHTISKVVAHPNMKYALRGLGKALMIAVPLIESYSLYSNLQEAGRVQELNNFRSDTLRSKAYTDFAVGAGTFGLMMTSGKISAMMVSKLVAGKLAVFVPGVGLVLAGGIIAFSYGGKALSDAVWGTKSKLQRNEREFVESRAPMGIKKHIISTTSLSYGLDTVWQENFGSWWQGSNFESLKRKTGNDAVRALVYLDTLKQDDCILSMVDTSPGSNELKEISEQTGIDISDLRNMVIQHQSRHEEIYNRRIEYMKSKLGTVSITTQDGKEEEVIDIKGYLSRSKISSNSGMRYIDILLNESYYYANYPDQFLSPSDLEDKKKELLSDLDQQKGLFEKFNNMRTSDKDMLLYNYAAAPSLVAHIDEYAGTGNPNIDKVQANIGYLDKFLLYKSLTTGYNIDSNLPRIDIDRLNFISLENFFTDLGPGSTILFLSEIQASYKEHGPEIFDNIFMDDKYILRHYNVSNNNVNNALHTIANEVLGYSISNNEKDLEQVFSSGAEHSHGIYLHNGRLAVNDTYLWWDSKHEYSTDDVLKSASNIQSIITSINRGVDRNNLITGTGSGSTHLNQEIGSKYISIFQLEYEKISRPDQTKENIFRYIRENSVGGKYVHLPIEYILSGVRIGMKDIGNYLYTVDGNRIVGRNPKTGQTTVLHGTGSYSPPTIGTRPSGPLV